MTKDDRALLKRANAARKFMENTCPASRHLHMIAEKMVKGQPVYDEPDHIGASILAVITALWEARDEVARLEKDGTL